MEKEITWACLKTDLPSDKTEKVKTSFTYNMSSTIHYKVRHNNLIHSSELEQNMRLRWTDMSDICDWGHDLLL